MSTKKPETPETQLPQPEPQPLIIISLAIDPDTWKANITTTKIEPAHATRVAQLIMSVSQQVLDLLNK